MKTYSIVGLGRFGSQLARELCRLGCEVLVVDIDADLVAQIADDVTHAVVGDGQDKDVLRALGIRDFDCGIVAIGDDLAASVLVTMNLKELGVPYVICKAYDETHRRVLQKLGADSVVIPEQEHDYVLSNTLRDAIFSNYYMKYGSVFFLLPFIFSSYVGSLTAYANRNYRTFAYDDSQYVVIVEYSDEVLAQPALIHNDELFIDTSEYCYLSKEGIVFSYRKYENVTIGDNQELTENTPSVPMEITDDTLPVDNGAFGQTEENTVPSAKSEQETE